MDSAEVFCSSAKDDAELTCTTRNISANTFSHRGMHNSQNYHHKFPLYMQMLIDLDQFSNSGAARPSI
jgi:hypothetical protein